MYKMHLITINDLYKNIKQLKRDDILKLRQWLKMQPHLPQIDDLQLVRFLHSCYFSNEAAKRCMDTFFTIRTHAPELFNKRSLNNPEIADCLKVVYASVMPKLSQKNYGILCVGLVDTNPEHFHANAGAKVLDISTSFLFYEFGPTDGVVVIADFKGSQLGHLLRLPLMTIKKYIFYMQEALPVRLKELHFINVPSWIDKFVSIVKPIVKKEIFNLLHIHQPNTTTLHSFVPKDCLPYELGGNCKSIHVYHDAFIKRLHEIEDLLKKEDDTYMVDETKRPGKPKTAGELFGVEGTFKKLDID